jgi:AhpD family alkylhydroperoxidase
MSIETYPEKYHRLQLLAGKLSTEISGPMKGFAQLHLKALEDGALSKKVKELMALAISITAPCAGCISYHVHDALRAGATHEEVLDAIGVAVMMGGGPGLVYGCEALEALNQFETENKNYTDRS